MHLRIIYVVDIGSSIKINQNISMLQKKFLLWAHRIKKSANQWAIITIISNNYIPTIKIQTI